MEKGTELYEYSCAENNRCEGGKCVAADVQKWHEAVARVS